MRVGCKLVVLSGESGSGKTTVCGRAVALTRARGLVVGGILTPSRFLEGLRVGLDVQDARSGRRRPLAERSLVADGPATGAWAFHAAGVAWGAAVLRRATPCDLLVVDELGPLELLRGQGWTVALDVLAAARCRLAVVVVRPALLCRFQEHLGGREFPIWTVTPANRETLADKIVAELEGEG